MLKSDVDPNVQYIYSMETHTLVQNRVKVRLLKLGTVGF